MCPTPKACSFFSLFLFLCEWLPVSTPQYHLLTSDLESVTSTPKAPPFTLAVLPVLDVGLCLRAPQQGLVDLPALPGLCRHWHRSKYSMLMSVSHLGVSAALGLTLNSLAWLTRASVTSSVITYSPLLQPLSRSLLAASPRACVPQGL